MIGESGIAKRVMPVPMVFPCRVTGVEVFLIFGIR